MQVCHSSDGLDMWKQPCMPAGELVQSAKRACMHASYLPSCVKIVACCSEHAKVVLCCAAANVKALTERKSLTLEALFEILFRVLKTTAGANLLKTTQPITPQPARAHRERSGFVCHGKPNTLHWRPGSAVICSNSKSRVDKQHHLTLQTSEVLGVKLFGCERTWRIC